MFIVDKDLKKLIDQNVLQIIVDNENPPFNPLEQIGASSIDLRLSRVFRKYKPGKNTVDLAQEEETEIIELPLDGELIIQPGEFLLGLTVEIIKLPANISGFIAARSSIARLGLSVVEQPLIHPGYTGAVALQLKNNIDRPIKIKPLLSICQVMFLYGTDFAEKPYGSNNTEKYFNERNIPQTSKIRVELEQIEDTSIDFAFVTALPKERDAILKYLDTYERVHLRNLFSKVGSTSTFPGSFPQALHVTHRRRFAELFNHFRESFYHSVRRSVYNSYENIVFCLIACFSACKSRVEELKTWISKEVAHNLPAKGQPSISPARYALIPC